MLPSEISYLAQERCKDLRGERREPVVSFFEFRLGKVLTRLFKALEPKDLTHARPNLEKKLEN
jgi:hypothetical protein